MYYLCYISYKHVQYIIYITYTIQLSIFIKYHKYNIIYIIYYKYSTTTKTIPMNANNKLFEIHTSQGIIYSDYLINSSGLFAQYLSSKMDFYPKYAIPKCYYAKVI